jgi:hypothetical protein
VGVGLEERYDDEGELRVGVRSRPIAGRWPRLDVRGPDGEDESRLVWGEMASLGRFGGLAAGRTGERMPRASETTALSASATAAESASGLEDRESEVRLC